MFRIPLLPLIAISVLSFTFGSAGKGQDAGSSCKCLYGDACWPSESQFAELSSQLSQPLIHPVPSASACYPAENPSPDCAVVQANSFNGTWRADQAGSYQNVNFEGYIFLNGSISACHLDVSLGVPCEQGNVPPIGVDARNAGDIQAAVKFATDNNLRLVVKNTGHDYLGRSSARNGFMIWTHHMKSISYSETFVPEGGPEAETYQALTLGAGVQWREAYAAAQENNRYVVGGISPDASVGAAGGWIGGGGHSAFAPKYGLGVDNVIQLTIVTTNGEHVTANAHSNPDLFWALRGGGPGTYGVVTTVTYKTHPIEPLVAGLVTANFSSIEIAKSVGTEFLKLQPELSDAQWGGYSFYRQTNFVYILYAPTATMEQVNATLGPFLDYLKNTAGENNMQAVMFPAPSFYDVVGRLGANLDPQVGINIELASRLYTRDLYEAEPERMAETFLRMPGSLGVAIAHVAGGVASQIDPDSVGLNPAWRSALGLVFTGAQWDGSASATEIQAQKDVLKEDVDVLESLEPGTGSYVNEGSLYEPNPQWTYFGDHYERLLEIKDKYDAKGLFVVAAGVGSERWNDGLNCRKDQ
ncbi:hypothetical protein PM082_007894 [Marasmius tenuissimus]|nr:hypothetical protein PM082_007894 [Marasmius tenuissimus]